MHFWCVAKWLNLYSRFLHFLFTNIFTNVSLKLITFFITWWEIIDTFWSFRISISPNISWNKKNPYENIYLIPITTIQVWAVFCGSIRLHFWFSWPGGLWLMLLLSCWLFAFERWSTYDLLRTHIQHSWFADKISRNAYHKPKPAIIPT